MKLMRKRGDVSNIWQIFIQDSSSTTGAGLAGLVFNSASLTAYYHRDVDTTATAITLVTMTVGTFTSGGFKEIDATNMPGWYQFCPPDASLSATSTPKSVGFHLKGATNMAPLAIEVQLDALDRDDGVRMGLTALPNVVSGASGGLPTLDAALNVSSLAVDSGTAQAGASTTITLRSGASATDNLYTGSVVTIYSGTGAGQSRVIVGYVGSTKVATVLRTWAITPDNTSVYKIHGLAVPKVDDNLAVTVQAGTGTGQLDVTAGVVKANPTQINGDGTSAANLASSTRAIARGTVGSGSTTTSIVTSACTPSGAAANQFINRTVLFDGATTTTALRGQVASITASSNAAAPVFTVSTLTTAPASGDLFSIL